MRTLLLVASFLTLLILSSFAAAYWEKSLPAQKGTYEYCRASCSGGDAIKNSRFSCIKYDYDKNPSTGRLIGITSTLCTYKTSCDDGDEFTTEGRCDKDSDGDGEPDSEDADDDNDGDPDESDPHPNDPDCSSDSFDQFKCPGPDKDGNPDNDGEGDGGEDENNPDPDNDPDPDPGTDPDKDPEPNNPDPNDGGGGSNNGDDDEGSSDDDSNGGGSNGGGGGGNNNGPSTPGGPPRIICPDGSTSDDQQRCPPSDPHHGPGPHPDGDNQICEDGYPPLAGTCDRPEPNNFCPDGTPNWPGTVCKGDPDNNDPNPPENPPPDDYNPRPIPPDGDGPPDVNPDPSPTPNPGPNPTPTPGGPGPVDPDHNPNPTPDPGSPPSPSPGDDDSSGEDGDDSGGDDGDEIGGEGEGADSLGRSCETEPPCEGNDAVMCGIQLQTWKLRCQAEGAEGGDCSEANEPQCMEGTIHCEMLKQQHKLLCGEEVTLEHFKKAFKGAGITDDEELTDNYLKEKRTVDNESKLRGILESLRPPGMGGRTLGDQCYPIPPIVIFGSSIDIDIKYICKLLEVISMLMYLAAYIAAFHILFRTITEE